MASEEAFKTTAIVPKENDERSDDIERIGAVIERIELAKLQPTIEGLKTSDKDNERQFQMAKIIEGNSQSRWNKSFYIGVVATTVLFILSVYLIVTGDKELGISTLASTFTGVFGYIAGSGNCNKTRV